VSSSDSPYLCDADKNIKLLNRCLYRLRSKCFKQQREYNLTRLPIFLKTVEVDSASFNLRCGTIDGRSSSKSILSSMDHHSCGTYRCTQIWV